MSPQQPALPTNPRVALDRAVNAAPHAPWLSATRLSRRRLSPLPGAHPNDREYPNFLSPCLGYLGYQLLDIVAIAAILALMIQRRTHPRRIDMTLEAALTEISTIRARYPAGLPILEMDPVDRLRLTHLSRLIRRLAHTNQQRMDTLLYNASQSTPQPTLFEPHELYEVLSVDDATGEGMGAYLGSGGSTTLTILPIQMTPDGPVPHPSHGPGLTLTFDEVVRIVEEFGPLAYQDHPCPRCYEAAPASREYCTRCEPMF